MTFLLFAFGIGLTLYGAADERDVVLLTGALLASVAVVASALARARPQRRSRWLDVPPDR